MQSALPRGVCHNLLEPHLVRLTAACFPTWSSVVDNQQLLWEHLVFVAISKAWTDMVASILAGVIEREHAPGIVWVAAFRTDW